MCCSTGTRKCKKTRVKKSKVTNQISTCASNKKDNEKYYQHYADDDAENTIIDLINDSVNDNDLVNDDCLAEIFTYLPVCERPKIALVCKKWKKALDYSWQDVKKLELTHWEYYDECPSYLNKYPTYKEQLRFLRSLFDKCGFYITELDLTAYGHCNIVPVINKSCLNLVKLRLRFKYIERKVLVNAFSLLPKLKVLKIIFQYIHNNGYIPVTLINLLKSVAGTLTELTLLYWDRENVYKRLRIPKTFTRILPELKALKSIETAGILIDTDLHMHLENFGILVISYDSQRLEDNVHNTLLFKHVQTMEVLNYPATDDLLYTIANCLEQLTLLEISCEQVTDAGIVALSKMNNLNFIDLNGLTRITDSSVKLLKNLEFLRVPNSNRITNVSITKVLENSPTMKTLYILDSPITFEFIEKAGELATNRKSLLNICLPNTPGILKYESQYLKLVLFNSEKDAVYWSESSNCE